MSAIVTLTVTRGDGKSETFDFDTYSHCLVGRADDCIIQMPTDPAHADISRHHCLFVIDPPHIQVRDLGSMNGTFVNEEMIGHRRDHQTPEDAAAELYAGRELNDGDVVRVGKVAMRVGVLVTEMLPDPIGFL